MPRPAEWSPFVPAKAETQRQVHGIPACTGMNAVPDCMPGKNAN